MLRKLLEFGARLPSFVVFLFSILEIFFNINWIGQLDEVPFLKQWHPWIYSHVAHILVITGVLYTLSKISLFYLDKKEDRSSGEALHSFCHELRNRLFILTALNIEHYKNSETGLEEFYCRVRDMSEGICRNIFNFLKAYTNKDFAVCIKLLKPTASSQSMAKEDIEIMTLCREGAKKVERSQQDFNEEIRLVDNTDFELIFDSDGDEESNIFAIPNLPFFIFQRFLAKNKYKTSTKKPLRKYKSTVVTPIRIPTTFLPETRRTNSTYTIIGFLCIDYKRILSRKEMKRIKDYIKSMGDSLYPFFDNVMLIDQAIRG